MKHSIHLPRGEWSFDDAQRLGSPGGFGEVFAGSDAKGTPLAVKRLKVTAAQAAHRELTIAEELARKKYQHILAPIDSGQDANTGEYFLVMPRADKSLADQIAGRGPIPEKEALDVLIQIASGLLEIPQLVHRDLKPPNILLHNGSWKIADFGIARFVEESTSANTLKGFLSAPFAAPEQWNGEHATNATDVYALCCIAYVLLTGSPPFPGPAQADYRLQHLSATPAVISGADPRLRSILTAGLRKPQSGRPNTSRVETVMRDVLANAPTPAPIAALQEINAAQAEHRSKAVAQAERERNESKVRAALVDAGRSILEGILSRMADVANEHLNEAQICLRQGGLWDLDVSIGSARLHAGLDGPLPPNVTFPYSKWQPLAIGRIEVTQSEPHEWEHGATLWYMRINEKAELRWYEVSYKQNALVGGPLVGPFAIQSLGDSVYQRADEAAGPGMGVIQLESRPEPIDDENTDKFVERWLARLAQAFNGKLRPF